MKKILSSILLAGSMTSYAGYIVPDTSNDESNLNYAVSAGSFKKVNNASLDIESREGTTSYDDSDDEDNTSGSKSLYAKLNKDKITLESFLTLYDVDYSDADGTDDTLKLYNVSAAILLNENLSIGGGVAIFDWDDEDFDSSTKSINFVYKLQENMFLGGGLAKQNYGRFDMDIDTYHGGFGMMHDQVDFEVVAIIKKGGKDDSSYFSDTTELQASAIVKLDKIEIKTKLRSIADVYDFKSDGLDSEEAKGVFYIAPEYMLSEKLSLGLSLESTASIYDDNDDNDFSYEKTSSELGVFGKVKVDNMQFYAAVTSLSSETDYEDSDDEEEEETSLRIKATYKF